MIWATKPVDRTEEPKEPEAARKTRPPERAVNASRPGVFLMTNSFETGGTERQFVALARSLDPTDFRLHLGCIKAIGGFQDGLGSVPEFPLGGSLYKPQSVKARWRLSRHLRVQDVAIAHAFDFYTNLTLIPAARMARVPVVIGSHRQIGDLLTPAQFRAQAVMFSWCDKVVCNSQAAANRLLASGVKEHKVAIIGNGLEEPAFARTEAALPRLRGQLRVGMIARMNTRDKNHEMFLRVAAELCTQSSNVEFLLAGDGPLRSEFERLAKDLRIGDRVRFLGDRRDISAILASLDIVVVPSFSESLSNVALESMAAGLPVVAANVGGNPELLSNNRGILFPSGDSTALCGSIQRLLQDAGLRTGIGNRARNFAEANFRIERVTRQYEDLYSEQLQRNQWQPRFAKPDLKPSSTRQVRVALVGPSLRYVGGQAVQADLLLRNWDKDPDVQLRFIPVDPPFPSGLGWLRRLPVLRTLVREPMYFLALWRQLKGVDVAHIFSASYWSFLLAPAPALVLARLRRKKVLINYRSGEARDHLRRFRTARPLLARADRLVVPSGYLVDVFREFGLAAQIVPNIVDLSQFSFRKRSPLRPHLVCTRGFHPYYRVDLVVRAFAEIQREFPQGRLDLVGGGPEEGQIRKLVSQLSVSGVNFTGVATRQEIGRFYDAADIFINASSLDNMPVSILEGFASGTPVVSTAPEGIRYLVEHERTGLLSEPGDASALAQNVIRLLREPGLASRIALNAYEQSENYSWTAVREKWLEIYRSMVGLAALQSPK